MRYLLDTVVVSEPNKFSPNQLVLTFLQGLPSEDSFVSVITVGEIAKGIALMPEGARKRAFQVWFSEVKASFADRILPIDEVISELWGELTAMVKNDGDQLDVPDGLIAATALVHGLTVVTRNVDDFVPTGVPIHNPWETS